MSKAIEVGCWAVVVRGLSCCGFSETVPIPFIVLDISKSTIDAACYRCHAITPVGTGVISGFNGNPKLWVSAYRCKRLDPPAEETASETEKKVEA